MSADPFFDIAEAAAPDAVALIQSMQAGSAERHYSARYLSYRLMGMDTTERPAASGYGLGVDHAAELRERIDEALPAEAVEQR